jgi:ubiquinone/menaquinone biosynthesis C-methylase UbiE
MGKNANIIDIGGGDSRLVDFLLEEGYENISVLDISERALDRAIKRLGNRASKIKWIVSDILDFIPDVRYDFWHDRATFHFLTEKPQLVKYLSTARQAVKLNGWVTVGTFSTEGPERCSGLEIKQYREETLTAEFEKGFVKIECKTEDHLTPFHSTQHFIFCSFQRNSN